MKTLDSTLELQELIQSSPALLVYFYNDTCLPCKALRPKVEEMLVSQFPKIEMVYVNSENTPAVSASNNVFSSPTIIIYFDGRETIRESKYVSINLMKDKIERYYNLMFTS